MLEVLWSRNSRLYGERTRHPSDAILILRAIHQAVQKFIGTPESLEHKRSRFKSLDLDVSKSGAFTIEDENIRKQFEAE